MPSLTGRLMVVLLSELGSEESPTWRSPPSDTPIIVKQKSDVKLLVRLHYAM